LFVCQAQREAVWLCVKKYAHSKDFVYSTLLTQNSSFVQAILLRAEIIYLLDRQPAEQVLGLLTRTLQMDPDNAPARVLFKKLKAWEALKKAGNEAFTKGAYAEALEKYNAFLDAGVSGKPKAKVLSNRATVYSKVFRPMSEGRLSPKDLFKFLILL
jgi:hypothetical protein